jgi:putative ABC transport system substrate-binding protein
MKRRQFIALIGGCAAAWPLRAVAQQSVPTIGFLRSSSLGDAVELVAAFRQSLKEAGYIENQSIAIEYRWADGRLDQLPKLAVDLVEGHVAAIVANQTAVPAVKAATDYPNRLRANA